MRTADVNFLAAGRTFRNETELAEFCQRTGHSFTAEFGGLGRQLQLSHKLKGQPFFMACVHALVAPESALKIEGFIISIRCIRPSGGEGTLAGEQELQDSMTALAKAMDAFHQKYYPTLKSL